MARRAIGEENIRKLQVTGRNGASYMVTLPKIYIEKLEWQENQKLVVELDDKKKQLVISDWTE